MPDEFKLVICMFYFEEYSYKDIAEALDMPIGTVMSRLHYARRRIRTELEAAGLFGSASFAPNATEESGA